MLKVVVTDYSFEALDVETRILQPLGCEVVGGQCKTPERLLPFVRDADAVITQFAPMNAEVIAAMRQGRVIVRYGVGVDNVDLAAARERAIPVCNVPDYCTDEVADHTLALILAAMRNVVTHSNAVRAGRWGLAVPLEAMRTLREQTVGVVAFGRIGREVARRLIPFKCRVLVFDPVVSRADIEGEECTPVDLPQLLGESDIVTLHCPSSPQTRGLIDRQALARMKRGAVLINLARGDLIDSAALIEALQQGQLAAAALDVFAPEPIPAGSPILQMENVIFSPHIASASAKAARTLRETVAGIVAKALRGEKLPNVVNGVGQ